MRIKHTIAPALVLVLFGALLAQLPLVLAARSSDNEWFDPIIVVRRHLLDRYVEQPDEQAMQRAMIDAMIGTLGDPHTVYIPPSGEAEFNKELHGTYVGIGAEVIIVDDSLTIVTPMEDSPALEAGVLAGDVVLEIEGESISGRSIDECINLLLGEAGTEVTIRVRHLDDAEEDLAIVRRRIITPTVKGVRRVGETWDYRLDEQLGVGYLRITQFSDSTVADFRAALDQLQSTGLNGLVLDLRSNPGGELAVAIQIADLFLCDGMIVSVKGRDRPAQSWHAEPEGTLPDFPMVVLVNRFSASASEILAGALQDSGRAKVLGTRTYGKASVQEVHELPYDGGTLKLTSGHYYLSSGRNLARQAGSTVWGVDPDPGFVVSIANDAYLAMLQARRQFEIIRPDSREEQPRFADPDWIRAQLSDEQLAAALEALQARLQGKDWPVVGEHDATLLALELEIQRTVEHHRRVEQRLRELHELAERAGKPPLLPPDADTTQGTLTIHDRYENLIGTYRIEGGDLEFALGQVRLTPIEPDER